ncbi:MAG: CRR6 family NdhI maturation factor [Thainema sp.]
MTSITLTETQIQTLDLTAAEATIQAVLKQIETDTALSDINLHFDIQYSRDANDPRELSEIPEVRLWFVRLDTRYPWLPLVLDWEAGELGRYAAMLIPHQFSPTEGIRYNPEALEIFVMSKVFISLDWMKQNGILNRTRLKFMTQMLGYELDDSFFELFA